MSTQSVYLQLAEDLLTTAARFEQGDHDQVVDDDDFARTEVLTDFVEQWLEGKITPEIAAEINYMTKHSGNIDAHEIAPRLERILSAKV